MKVVVMGAGIVGVTTSYFLARHGFEVEVIEKNENAGLGCSYANGGQLSFSHIEPFSSRSSFNLIAKSLIKPNSFSHVESFKDKDFLKFCFKFIKNYGSRRTKEISKNLFFLGQESRLMLNLIKDEEDIDFNYKKAGILHFYKNRSLFERAMKQAEFQTKLGDKIEILSADECVKKEPTLSKIQDENKLLGAIFHENDASGDATMFCKKLAKICQEKYGVKFHYDTEIKNILTNYKKITGVNTSKDVHVADHYVFALGSYGNSLLEGINIKSGILPVKGYSLSIPTNSEFLAPNIGVTDPENKIVYSRIGNIFRAAGTVEISNSKKTENKRLLNFLKNKIRENFSDYGDLTKAKEWQGIRPFRANSTPLIKKCEKYDNLFFNSGHGHLGWTMSFGSAKILTNLILGKKQERFSFLDKEQCL